MNTKFVLGLSLDLQRVFEQQKNHLRSVTSDRRPPAPSAEKVTFSSVFFLTPSLSVGELYHTWLNHRSKVETILIVLGVGSCWVLVGVGGVNVVGVERFKCCYGVDSGQDWHVTLVTGLVLMNDCNTPQLICKFFYMNHEWTIEEYNRRRDPAKQVTQKERLC